MSRESSSSSLDWLLLCMKISWRLACGRSIPSANPYEKAGEKVRGKKEGKAEGRNCAQRRIRFALYDFSLSDGLFCTFRWHLARRWTFNPIFGVRREFFFPHGQNHF